jgi:hypothetical protein
MCNLLNNWCTAIIWSEFYFNLSWLGNYIVLTSVLVTESVSADNDWFNPAWNETRNISNHNWLTEYCSIKDVSDCSIWTLPHLSQIKLLNTLSIGCDCCTFNSNLVFQDSFGAVNCNLIFCLVTVCNTQVVILLLYINIWVDVLVFDPVPNNFCHLVSIDVNNWFSNMYFSEGRSKITLAFVQHFKILIIHKTLNYSVFRENSNRDHSGLPKWFSTNLTI